MITRLIASLLGTLPLLCRVRLILTRLRRRVVSTSYSCLLLWNTTSSTMASKPILSSVSTLEQVKDALGKEVEVRDFVGAVDELPTCHLLPKIFGEHLHQLEMAEQVYSSYFRGSKLGSTLEMQAVPPYLLPLLWVRCFYGSLPQILLLFTYTPQLDMIHNILAGPALGTAEFTGSTTHAR